MAGDVVKRRMNGENLDAAAELAVGISAETTIVVRGVELYE
jgi:hypothetical protein